MYIFTNAVKNIVRNKGRNSLMAIIVFAIILTTAVSIIINTTTSAIITDYKSRFGAEVSIGADFEKLQTEEGVRNYKELTPQQQIAFGESDLLQSTNFSAKIDISPRNLSSLGESEMDNLINDFLSGATRADGTKNPETVPIKGQIIATDNPEANSDFKSGTRKITSGEMYKNLNECIVSEQYASLNNISVGDTIEVDSYYKNEPMTHSLTVTGIYMDNTMLGSNLDELSPMENRNNEILTSFETVVGMEMFDEYGKVSAQYFLKDPTLLPAFEKELREKGLTDYYEVTTDEAGYKKIVGPVEGLAKVTNTFLIVVLILGALILILLSTLAIRERKYEIGVLRAMGMTKGKVAFGLLTEMLVITGVCLCLGLSVGIAASQPVADSLLANQIELAQDSNTDGGVPASGRTGVGEAVFTSSNEKPLSELQVNLSLEAIFQIILIAFSLAGIASAAGILHTTKYEPIKILMERN
ncbi:putative ABC transport system permease protein [Evansella caseinilytica]|uniref:Putative ABC transport system permease protein n=1 Tax=Evansella caseinilytica TaxID=1503961 RepID=A0A1H3TQH1_9BACI|nr:FtsX-like permease family protein [Evansella caseinilytica]SDZ51895.1 putative ABC transport system permease protein [Evansella caseinilytica]